MRGLVENGQLTFINGGWSMHDEANPSWVDMLDNTFVGHRNIANNFGRQFLPTVTWQIDPVRVRRVTHSRPSPPPPLVLTLPAARLPLHCARSSATLPSRASCRQASAATRA